MAEDAGRIELGDVLGALRWSAQAGADQATHRGPGTTADVGLANAGHPETPATVEIDARRAGSKGKFPPPSPAVLDNAWRGAEAYHYYLLAQRQLYQAKMEAAMKTAIRLAEFEDILDPRHIYSLIALAAYNAQYLNICSRAFIKLETLPGLEEKEREALQDLALKIFLRTAPNDVRALEDEYLACLETGTPYQVRRRRER
ncbi:unnamed protein product [Heterosigma akashiwo]